MRVSTSTYVVKRARIPSNNEDECPTATPEIMKAQIRSRVLYNVYLASSWLLLFDALSTQNVTISRPKTGATTLICI
jgi:hypothetical protein